MDNNTDSALAPQPRALHKPRMGFRFRSSLKIAPGLRLNFGKKGTSLSIGGKGITTNISERGVRNTVGIPGTGISYTSYERHQQPAPGGTRVGVGLFLGFAAVVIVLVVLFS